MSVQSGLAFETARVSPLEWLGYPRPLTPEQITQLAGNRQIFLTCAPGQVEPFSIAVFAGTNALHDVKLEMTPLRGAGTELAAGAFDPFWVVRWYRGLATWYGDDEGRRAFVPQLLLKNPSLIGYDHDKKLNVYRWAKAMERGLPQDTPTLQPADIGAEDWGQFYVRVRIPLDAKPGRYTSTVSVTAKGQPTQTFDLEVTVPDITLFPACKDYHIWAHMGLNLKRPEPFPEGEPLSDAGLNRSQYTSAMRTFAAAGWQPNFATVDDHQTALGIWKAAGLGWMRIVNITPTTEQAFRETGFPGTYLYVDMDTVGQAGQETFLRMYRLQLQRGRGTCQTGVQWSERVGRLVSCPVWEYGVPPERTAFVHRQFPADGRALFHAAPMLTAYWPFNYRLQYGFWLWHNGADGAFPYTAYVNNSGQSFWVDGNTPGRLPWGLVAPARDGLIVTTSWEAMRDAVNDVRYLTTLTAQLARAAQLKKLNRSAQEVVAAAAEFEQKLPGLPLGSYYGEAAWGPTKYRDGRAGYDSLQALRAQTLKHILAIQKADQRLATRTLAADAALREQARLYSLRGRTAGEDSLRWVIHDLIQSARLSARPARKVVADAVTYANQIERLILFGDEERQAVRQYAQKLATEATSLPAARAAEAQIMFLVDFLDHCRWGSGPRGEQFLQEAVAAGRIGKAGAEALRPWCAKLGYATQTGEGLQEQAAHIVYGTVEKIYVPPAAVGDFLQAWGTLKFSVTAPAEVLSRDALARAERQRWLSKAQIGVLHGVLREVGNSGSAAEEAGRLARQQPYLTTLRSGTDATAYAVDLMRASAAYDLLTAAGNALDANRIAVASQLRLGDSATLFGPSACVESLAAAAGTLDERVLEADFEAAGRFGEKWDSLWDLDGIAEERGWTSDPSAQVSYAESYRRQFVTNEGWNWYRNTVTLPVQPQQRRVLLVVRGMRCLQKVWVNGRSVESLLPLAAWAATGVYDVTRLVAAGENHVVLRACLPDVPNVSLHTEKNRLQSTQHPKDDTTWSSHNQRR